MLSARAAMIAARSRGFIAGSGKPSFAATVSSRASLPNSLDLIASCRPLRCMMFLNCEWPAKLVLLKTATSGRHLRLGNGARYRSERPKNLFPERRTRFLEPPPEPHRRDARCQSRRIVRLDRHRAQCGWAVRWLELARWNTTR